MGTIVHRLRDSFQQEQNAEFTSKDDLKWHSLLLQVHDSTVQAGDSSFGE